jgi:hypothetical protein
MIMFEYTEIFQVLFVFINFSYYSLHLLMFAHEIHNFLAALKLLFLSMVNWRYFKAGSVTFPNLIWNFLLAI